MGRDGVRLQRSEAGILRPGREGGLGAGRPESVSASPYWHCPGRNVSGLSPRTWCAGRRGSASACPPCGPGHLQPTGTVFRDQLGQPWVHHPHCPNLTALQQGLQVRLRLGPIRFAHSNAHLHTSRCQGLQLPENFLTLQATESFLGAGPASSGHPNLFQDLALIIIRATKSLLPTVCQAPDV